MTNKPILIGTLIAGVALVAVVFYFVQQKEQVTTVSEPVTIPISEPQPVPEPEPEVPEPVVNIEPVPEPQPDDIARPAFVLPLLDESDQLIRDGTVSLTRHEGINGWLAPGQLVRKFVVFADNIGNGQIAKEPARVLTPEGPFLVKQVSEDEFLLDEAGYERYNFFTEIVLSIDARRAAEFYILLYPLFEEAYSELGYPDRKFNDVVFRAIGRLLETPVLEGPIRLKQPVVMYEFADQRLESLSAVQKQMIRMGPKNTRAIQTKLSEVALELRSLLED